MTENFDISSLNQRIAEVKQENEECTQFTFEFIDCLLKRHDLSNMLQDDQEFDGIPSSMVKTIYGGECPKKDEISKLDIDTQDTFIKDLVWICGMGAISWYCDNEKQYQEMEPSPFEEIIKMPTMSIGHHSASFIIAAFVLLTATIPTQLLVESITNNFDSNQEQLEKNAIIYNDLCFCILKRFKEDLNYFTLNNKYQNN
jgi:hypothetical protein